jgi:hypothetical protein
MTLNIELDPETEAKLAAEVERQGLDASEIIMKLVRTYLPLVETGDDIDEIGGKTLGAIMDEIGYIEGGPPDMARHPEKYMQGFGETKSRRTLK